MPRYLKPHADGVVRGPSQYISEESAVGLVLATSEQKYPCHADGTPLTVDEVAALPENQMPPKVKAVAERMLALVADMGLPPPKDLATAIASTKTESARKPTLADRVAYLEQALELVTERLELLLEGGTWSDVMKVGSGE